MALREASSLNVNDRLRIRQVTEHDGDPGALLSAGVTLLDPATGYSPKLFRYRERVGTVEAAFPVPEPYPKSDFSIATAQLVDRGAPPASRQPGSDSSIESLRVRAPTPVIGGVRVGGRRLP